MPAGRKRAAASKENQVTGRKPTLSPTRIATYLECAVKYRYIYIDKIGRFYTRARAGFSFGSTLHHVLQEFHQRGAAQTSDQLVVELEQRWIGAGYETVEKEQAHREAGQQIVQAYHAAHQERIEAQVETVATEKTISIDMGRFKLSGRVDRIDRHPDGALEIIDYKSGRLETSPEEVANSLAMSCYQLILKRMHPEAQVYGTIYCLRSGHTASAELANEALEEFARDILTLGEQILDTEYMLLKPVPNPACPDCDFLRRCTRFWQEEAQCDLLDAPFPEED